MIYSQEQIEWEVSQLSGTHIKRNNLRKKLKLQSNAEVNERISKIKSEIRGLKSLGVKEQDLRLVYAKVSKLEVRIL